MDVAGFDSLPGHVSSEYTGGCQLMEATKGTVVESWAASRET